MLSKFIISLGFLFNIIPVIFSSSAPSGNDSNGLYNPFNFMHLESHKIYLLGPAFIILFFFIKLGSEKEFNYCCLACYKNCSFSTNFKVVKRSLCRTVCLTHRTSPGNLFPESAFLITAGVLPAVAMLLLGVTLDGTLSAKVFFNIILVPIIMSAGWATDKMTFYQNIGTILWFAIFGTVLNAAILMPLLYYGSTSRWNIYSRLDMDLVDAGLYSILICAVDPVAVLSVFEAMHIDKLVYNVVFGESLLNDGVAVNPGLIPLGFNWSESTCPGQVVGDGNCNVPLVYVLRNQVILRTTCEELLNESMVNIWNETRGNEYSYEVIGYPKLLFPNFRVFYNAFDEMKTIHNLRFFESVGLVFLFFLYAFAISVVLAFTMAIIISFISRLFFHHQPMQFVVIFTLNYLTYIIGDTIKGSGILSLFFCVLLQRQYVQANLTYTSNRIITEVLTQLALLAEGIVFILMGLTAFSSTGISTNTDVPFSFYLIFLCYTTRYIVIYTLGFIANFFRKEKLDYRKGLFIQSHGGLRGAIGFALSLTIDEKYPYRFIFQTSTFIMVFFSVFVLGATIKPLVNLCKVPLEKHLHKTIILSLQEKVIDRTKEAIKSIIGSTSVRFRWEIGYRKINNLYFKRWLMDTKAIERNVSHSSVVKLHRDQSITDAQQIAGIYGTMMAKDIFKSGGDVRLRMYKKAWNSYASLHSFSEVHGKGQDDLYSSHSIPDLSIFDKTVTRRDVDDQMTHHNMKEGMGRRFVKGSFSKNNKKKRPRRINPDTDGHRLKCYKVPRRIIDIKFKKRSKSSEDKLNNIQKRYNAAPKMNKNVTFNHEEALNEKPVFRLGQQDKSISELIDNDHTFLSLADDSDYARFTQAYSNVAYENDDQNNNLAVGSKTRNMSVFDPFMGNGTFDIAILNQKPPWVSNNNESSLKVDDPGNQKTIGLGQATKSPHTYPANNPQSRQNNNNNNINKSNQLLSVHKF